MALPSRDIVILAVGQALSSTVVSLLTSVSSLTGALLAPVPSLSTVPVTATVLGTLAMIYPAALIMGRLGRRGGFLFKAAAGVLGGAICVLGVATTSFAILVAGTFLLGISPMRRRRCPMRARSRRCRSSAFCSPSPRRCCRPTSGAIQRRPRPPAHLQPGST